MAHVGWQIWGKRSAAQCVLVLLFSLLISLARADEKVLIYTYSYNRPDFIEIQQRTFQKFLKDSYEFVVFNDATDSYLYQQIHATCSRLNIHCIDIPQYIHELPYLYRLPREYWNHPSVRNSNVVQYSLDHFGFKHDGLLILLDSDLFLVKEFSFKEYMKEHALGGLYQSRREGQVLVEYLWIGIAFLNLPKMPYKETIDFNCGEVANIPVDPGGHTYYYLQEHPDLPVRFFDNLVVSFANCPSCEEAQVGCVHNTEALELRGFDPQQIAFIQSGPLECEYVLDGTFLHYRAGSNWNHRSQEFHARKTAIFKAYIDAITQSSDKVS